MLAAFGATVLMVGAAGAATPTPDVRYPDDPALQRAYEDGFYDGVSDGYGDGRDDGYEDGFQAGLSEGERLGREDALAEQDQGALRDDVAGEVEDENVDEGGRDIELTPTPTPADSTTTGVIPPEPESRSPGVPWWPFAIAGAVTVWFVLRRRRERQ